MGQKSLNGYERNVLYRNLGPVGSVRDIGPAAGTSGTVPAFGDFGYLSHTDRIEDGRAAVATDLDGDGDLDLLVQSYSAPTAVLINQGEGVGHWLAIKLRGTASNRDAVGARVEVEAAGRRRVREVTTTAGYLAGASLVCHFGLGEAERIERLTVYWPSGAQTRVEDLAVDQRLEIVEGAGLAGNASTAAAATAAASLVR